MKAVAFLGSGRCFHTMDWFRSSETLLDRSPIFITDNYGREGFVPLLQATDDVRELHIIDPLLPAKPSRIGHVWRNLLKLALVPLQILALRRALREIPGAFVFAHSTYYAFLASFCGVAYAATPQGSEVLVRPFRSRFYRWFLKKAMRRAAFVTVDSVAMQDKLDQIAGVRAHLVQNGINVAEIQATHTGGQRTLVTSIRGIDRNYRILEMLDARTESSPAVGLQLCYPFVEGVYFEEVSRRVKQQDRLLGRLSRQHLYALLRQSICVVSIPISDSSPRSVYEAIFCGAAVICTEMAYLQSLPECMRARLIVVDIRQPGWFGAALVRAQEIAAIPYVPSPEALELFDQRASMTKCLSLADGVITARLPG